MCGRGPLFNCILPLEYFVVTVTSGYIPPRKMPIMDPQQRIEWTQNSNPHCSWRGIRLFVSNAKDPETRKKKKTHFSDDSSKIRKVLTSLSFFNSRSSVTYCPMQRFSDSFPTRSTLLLYFEISLSSLRLVNSLMHAITSSLWCSIGKSASENCDIFFTPFITRERHIPFNNGS